LGVFFVFSIGIASLLQVLGDDGHGGRHTMPARLGNIRRDCNTTAPRR